MQSIDAIQVGVKLCARSAPHDKEIIDEAPVQETRSRRRAELAHEQPHEEVGDVWSGRDAHREAVDLQVVAPIEPYEAVIKDMAEQTKNDAGDREGTQEVEAERARDIGVQRLHVACYEVELIVGGERLKRAVLCDLLKLQKELRRVAEDLWDEAAERMKFLRDEVADRAKHEAMCWCYRPANKLWLVYLWKDIERWRAVVLVCRERGQKLLSRRGPSRMVGSGEDDTFECLEGAAHARASNILGYQTIEARITQLAQTLMLEPVVVDDREAEILAALHTTIRGGSYSFVAGFLLNRVAPRSSLSAARSAFVRLRR